MKTDLTPRQAIQNFIGGEHVEPIILRAAVAQFFCAYDELVDLASDVSDPHENLEYKNNLFAELVNQQTHLEEFAVDLESVQMLSSLVKSHDAKKDRRRTKTS